MDFIYNKEIISTLDEIKISVADLRDLIQARKLFDDRQAIDEYNFIIETILRKNNLSRNAFFVRLNGS